MMEKGEEKGKKKRKENTVGLALRGGNQLREREWRGSYVVSEDEE